MALTTNVARFHKEIFSKVRYDEMLEQYRINIGDYLLLNLTKRQFGVLERICQKNNIYIEKIPELLSVQESEQLFKKLHNLKQELPENYNFRIKQSEGKHHYKCIIACETKLCKIIYKLCTSDCLYSDN